MRHLTGKYFGLQSDMSFFSLSSIPLKTSLGGTFTGLPTQQAICLATECSQCLKQMTVFKVLFLCGGGGVVRLEISFNSCLDGIWDRCTLICVLTRVHVHLLIEAFCLRPLDHLISNGLQEHCPDKVVLFVFCRWACVSRYLNSGLGNRQIIVFLTSNGCYLAF